MKIVGFKITLYRSVRACSALAVSTLSYLHRLLSRQCQRSKASAADRCPGWRKPSRFGKYHLRLLEPSQPIWLSVMKHDTRTMWIYVTPPLSHLFPHRYSFLLELIGRAVPCLITGIHLGESQAALNDLSCLRGSDKSLCSINQSAFPWTQSFLTGTWVLILILNMRRGQQLETELCTAAS